MIRLDASTTRAVALAHVRRALGEAGIADAAIDARLLVVEALGIDATALVLAPDAVIGEPGAARLCAWTARRLAREPLGRIFGTREFWGLPFLLSPHTLEPRPDTETLVETALAAVPKRDAPLRLLDLGTGSGCVLVALLHELKGAFGIGTDRAPGALATARANARANGVAARAAFVAGDWAAALAGTFDLVVSNPPYIANADIAVLDPEVREHDPAAALAGGVDGLDAYRAILAQAPRLLGPDGTLALEIGAGQARDVARLAHAAGLCVTSVESDLAGVPRVVAARNPRPDTGNGAVSS